MRTDSWGAGKEQEEGINVWKLETGGNRKLGEKGEELDPCLCTFPVLWLRNRALLRWWECTATTIFFYINLYALFFSLLSLKVRVKRYCEQGWGSTFSGKTVVLGCGVCWVFLFELTRYNLWAELLIIKEAVSAIHWDLCCIHYTWQCSLFCVAFEPCLAAGWYQKLQWILGAASILANVVVIPQEQHQLFWQ